MKKSTQKNNLEDRQAAPIADLSSFKNPDMNEALDKLRNGLGATATQRERIDAVLAPMTDHHYIRSKYIVVSK